MYKIKQGSIIRIKGQSGVGRTTLSLQLAKELSNDNIHLIDIEMGVSKERLQELQIELASYSNIRNLTDILTTITGLSKDISTTVIIDCIDHIVAENDNEISRIMKQVKNYIMNSKINVIIISNISIKLESSYKGVIETEKDTPDSIIKRICDNDYRIYYDEFNINNSIILDNKYHSITVINKYNNCIFIKEQIKNVFLK